MRGAGAALARHAEWFGALGAGLGALERAGGGAALARLARELCAALGRRWS